MPGSNFGPGLTRYHGTIIGRMPQLIAADEIPISVSQILKQQGISQTPWGSNYDGGLVTGDTILIGPDGDAVIELDSLLLRSVNLDTPIYPGDDQSINPNNLITVMHPGYRVLSRDEWEEGKKDPSNLYLSRTEIENINDRGYIRRYGRWSPANRHVAKAWDYLGRGRNLREHAEFVSQWGMDSVSQNGRKSNLPEEVMHITLHYEHCGETPFERKIRSVKSFFRSLGKSYYNTESNTELGMGVFGLDVAYSGFMIYSIGSSYETNLIGVKKEFQKY
ncbi:MAG: hypothetical protein AABX98_06465 [Nanoarchaeota archaeon]